MGLFLGLKILLNSVLNLYGASCFSVFFLVVEGLNDIFQCLVVSLGILHGSFDWPKIRALILGRILCLDLGGLW